MKQNELILKLLQNYSRYGELDMCISCNPTYIDDPMEYIINTLNNDGIQTKAFEESPIYPYIDTAAIDLYSNGLKTGFQTGFDMAMVLLGCDPVYKALPETRQEKDLSNKAEAIASNIYNLIKIAGDEKVSKLVSSLGYSSVIEMIESTKKES